MLPSCSPGVFRQKSFRSSTPPPRVPAAFRNSRGASASSTNDRCAPRAATPAAAPNPAAAPPRDGGSRTASLSRGARVAGKHARLGTALASKMASASTSTVVQGWPNTKDDYELKEVIGEYRSPCGTRPTGTTIERFESGGSRAHLARTPPRERAPPPPPAAAGRRSR